MKSFRKVTLACTATLLLVATCLTPTYAATYASYNGVNGEALDADMDPGQGINLGNPSTSFPVLLRDQETEVTFHRPQDHATPVLDLWARSNHQFRKLDVFVPNWRGEYDQYHLNDALVTGYRSAPSSTEAETLTISFSGLE